MRLASITSIRPRHAILFAAGLFLVQQIVGTEIVFSLLTVLYILLSTFAFNLAGGLAYSSGAYIFFTAILTAIVGLVYKTILGEPGQTDLTQPTLTMLVYCGTMASLAVAAFGTRALRKKRALLGGIVNRDNMRRAATGCFLLGFALQFFAFLLPGQVYTALAQVNDFYIVAIVLSVYDEMARSDGKRSTNWIVWTAGFLLFSAGIIGFSKQGIFLPWLCWLLPCVLLGFRFKPLQLAGLVLATTFMVYYLVPYTQYARSFRLEDASLLEDIQLSSKYLLDLEQTRKSYLEMSASTQDIYLTGPHYFDHPQGFFDRLQMLAWDDALINYAAQGHQIGLAPTYLSYVNLIPRVFYPDKPTLGFGNLYARQMGLISANDTTTGISFSPAADAFYEDSWFGVLVVLPIIVFMLFLVFDSVAGDVRMSPWGIVPMATIAHIAPEGGLGESIHLTVYGALGLLLTAFAIRYIVPAVTELVSKGKAEQHRRINLGRPGLSRESPVERNQKTLPSLRRP